MDEILEKPSLTQDQMVKASKAAKHFGEVRRYAQKHPMLILDNGRWDTVILGYAQHEQLIQSLQEFEARYEASVLESRGERLAQHPDIAVPWRRARRSQDRE
ncbi:MAG: hypothetical protein C7B45_08590 [Sulfobacillus acidophilus]|uniref:Prevent-host-death protein n=1 Tax=Sulfobacillus acidophilus TaxID=53633 RepID=A0A2T2WII3_9FIRM|nr:MAG: hypothetical protein C7B45_08590 [Sulfobacillus acidophilus]